MGEMNSRSRELIAASTSAICRQAGLVARQAQELDSGDLLRPTRVAGWRVHEVLVHLARAVERVGKAVNLAEPRVHQRRFLDLRSSPGMDPAPYRQRVIEDAAGVPPGAAAAVLAQATGTMARRLARVESDRLVVARPGTMWLSDLLQAHSLETLVHSRDIADAVGADPRGFYEPRALVMAEGCLPRTDAKDVLEALGRVGTSRSLSWLEALCPGGT